MNVPLLNLSPELLFQCVAGFAGLPQVNTIREFSRSYRPCRVVCKLLTDKVHQCWKACLEVLWNDWKGEKSWGDLSREDFVKQCFSSNFIFNWFDGKPKITKRTYKEISNKEALLCFDNEILYKLTESSNPIPITFMGSLTERNYRNFHYICNQSVAIKLDRSSYGSAIFYSFKDKCQIGIIEGTAERSLLINVPGTRFCMVENAFCVFTAVIDKESRKYSDFGLSVYDTKTSPISEIRHIKLPFKTYSACATKSYFVCCGVLEGSLVLAATPLKNITTLESSKEPLFLFSSALDTSGNIQLVEHQDKVYIVSLEKRILTIQNVEITNEGVILQPVEMQNTESLKFRDLVSVLFYLDKLFVIVLDMQWDEKIISIDLVSKKLENTFPMERVSSYQTSIVSISLGVIQVFQSLGCNPHVTTLDYT